MQAKVILLIRSAKHSLVHLQSPDTYESWIGQDNCMHLKQYPRGSIHLIIDQSDGFALSQAQTHRKRGAHFIRMAESLVKERERDAWS